MLYPAPFCSKRSECFIDLVFITPRPVGLLETSSDQFLTCISSTEINRGKSQRWNYLRVTANSYLTACLTLTLHSPLNRLRHVDFNTLAMPICHLWHGHITCTICSSLAQWIRTMVYRAHVLWSWWSWYVGQMTGWGVGTPSRHQFIGRSEHKRIDVSRIRLHAFSPNSNTMNCSSLTKKSSSKLL
jgi:hypothetical protein